MERQQRHRRRLVIGTMMAATVGGLGIAVVPQAFAVIGGRPGAGPVTASAVQLTAADGTFCTGSLIAAQWVVTARHCLNDTTTVRAGSLIFGQGGQSVKIDNRVPGPDDLGLVHLARPVDAPPIQIAAQSPAPGSQATLMGWGQTSNNDTAPAHQLQTLDVTVVSPRECESSDIDPGHELCIGVSRHATDCFGDSGGPLVVDGQLVGADSRGPSDVCGQGGGDVYTDVVAARSFITRTIGQDERRAR